MPGSAYVDFGDSEYRRALSLSADLAAAEQQGDVSTAIAVQRLMSSLGLEARVHRFRLPSRLAAAAGTEYGETLYAVVRAARAAGTEAIVVSSLFNGDDRNSSAHGVSGTGLTMSLFNLFQSRRWLAKDLILVLADARFGDLGIRSWLDAYHSESSSNSSVQRAGLIQAAVHVDIRRASQFEYFVIRTEGYNGQLPNLDLLNTMHRLVVRDGVHAPNIVLSSADALHYPAFVPDDLVSLFNFMLNQARGVPTGAHGAYKRHYIDAVTVSNYNTGRGTHAADRSRHPFSMNIFGRALEGTVRSLNNLSERLHQSFYYYLLPSTWQYVSIGEYMISLALLLAAFFFKILFTVISLPYETRCVHSMAVAAVLYLGGLLLFVAPFLLPSLGFDPQRQEGMMAWAAVAVVLATATFTVVLPWVDATFGINGQLDSSFKSFACVPALLFLSTMSLLNASFSILLAIVLVPFYTVISRVRSSVGNALQLGVLLAVSPPTVLWAASLALGVAPPALLATIFSEYVEYGNLTFPFATLVYVPLNLCYIKMLLSPS